MENQEKQFEGFDPEIQSWNFPMVINGWVYKLSGAEFKILWYILRHTYGWQKNSDFISYRQFRYGIKKKNGKWLDKGTGLSFPSIKKAIDGLRKKGFVEIEKRRDSKGKQSETIYKPRLKKLKSGNPRLKKADSTKLIQLSEATIVNNEQSLNTDNRLEKPTKRKHTKFPNSDYKKVIDVYQKAKRIELKGKEFDPVMQDIKTMFMSKRTPDEIIACIEWMAKDDFYKDKFTIKTVRLKLPEFLTGKFEEEIDVPDYAKH